MAQHSQGHITIRLYYNISIVTNKMQHVNKNSRIMIYSNAIAVILKTLGHNTKIKSLTSIS